MKFEHISKFTLDCKKVKENPILLKEDYPNFNLIVEFKENLISLPTKEGKEGVIIHYLNELDDCMYALIDFLPNYEEYDESDNSEDVQKFNHIGVNIVNTFLALFELVQQYCIFFELDFFKLSKFIGFDLGIVPLIYFEIDFENNEKEGLEIDLQQDNEKIFLLYKLGIIDILRTKFKGLSNLRIGEILFPVTGIKANTTAQFIGRFQTENINPKVISKIESIINRLKLN